VAGDGVAAAVVDQLLEVLADLEEGEALGGHGHRLPGAGVAPVVGLVRAHREAPEAADLDALAALQGLGHGVEDAVDHQLGARLGELAASGDGVDELALGHLVRSPAPLAGLNIPAGPPESLVKIACCLEGGQSFSRTRSTSRATRPGPSTRRVS